MNEPTDEDVRLDVTFPDHVVVTAPDIRVPGGRCRLRLEVEAERSRIPDLRRLHGERVVEWRLRFEAAAAAAEEGTLEGLAVRVPVRAEDLVAVGRKRASFARTHVTALVRPDEDCVGITNFLSAFGWRPHIDPSVPARREDTLVQVAELYLTGALLETPIEPFHTVLRAIVEQNGETLWSIEDERVGVDFAVDASGRVALSRRWRDRGVVYGQDDDPWEDLTASPAMGAHLTHEESLFRDFSSCVTCRHFTCCAGFLRAVDDDYPCNGWMAAFDRLVEAAHRSRELLKTAAGED